jgi:chaperone modulatory protein CbpM
VTGTRLALRPRPVGAYSIEEIAAAAGVHPELARRLARMGLIDPLTARPDLWPAVTAMRLARAVRLRRDLGLSYSAALLVAELTERIEDLEARLRHDQEERWTRVG